jgi:CheY-like chemotaxis protein
MSFEDWRVLVVEDESDSRDMVRAVLQHHGISCVTAATAEDALRALDDVMPTLVITDLALPGLDGWDLLAELMANPDWEDIPRVAVTAYHTVELAERAIEEGFDAYFAKPIDIATFVSDLQRIVGDDD